MANPLPRACKSINELNVGDEIRLDYSVSDSDVQKFGEISGDFNPAHFNEDYAKGTVFKSRIAHGMISVAKFSGIFGMDMPGLGAIWGGQTLKFLAPVYLNAALHRGGAREGEGREERRLLLLGGGQGRQARARGRRHALSHPAEGEGQDGGRRRADGAAGLGRFGTHRLTSGAPMDTQKRIKLAKQKTDRVVDVTSERI